MTKHSKNNTASSIFSYAEYKKLDYGTKRMRLSQDSMRKFDSCSLCLNTARDPVSCEEGHLFCKECAYTDLLKQKQDIKKQKAKLDAMQKEIEQAKDQARAAARERVLMEFEKGQRSLGGAINTITTSGAESTQGSSRGTKRKFAFDTSAAETLAQQAEEAALRQIEREQMEELKAKLPDFWLPSLTPTYTSSNPESLKDIKVQTTCRGGAPTHSIAMKNLVPVKFSFLQATSDSRQPSGPPPSADAICLSCKKVLSNSILLFLMRPCSHVTCRTCTDTLVRPSKQCTVCDHTLGPKDITELRREGTGFASGGLSETSKRGVAFQG